jgi:MerR family transcriptional regulator, copper efflux regulator
MNIGQAAKLSGVSAKMIRHYEALGLLPKASRTQSGYRQYAASDVHTLRFIRRARDLGFGIASIAGLVELWQNRRRASEGVKRMALAHVEELATRIEEMKAMKRTLEHLAAHCHGDERPDCPILDDLAAESAHASPPLDAPPLANARHPAPARRRAAFRKPGGARATWKP